jgi:YbbR domain-containing protein
VKTIWPFRHIGLKVVSLAIAALLWLIVAGEETVERGLRVPLELQQFPQGLELQGEWPTFVDVRVRGASGTLSRISPAELVAVIDLHAARPGARIFQLTPEQVRTPFGVQVVQVSPATVALSFEPSKTRTVRVTPKIEGQPDTGFVMGSVTVTPSTVEVMGPESSVSRVTEAVTEPVTIAGAKAALTETVTIGFLDPALRLKTPRQATVTVQVFSGPDAKVVHDRPIHLRNIAQGLSAQALPSVADVTLRGTKKGLTRIENNDVLPFVDVEGLGVGEYLLDVRVDDRPEAGVTHIEPSTVQVRISSGKN